MSFTFGSVCSGVEAASIAWSPLGARCVFVAEIEPYPCHVLHQRLGASRPQYMPDPLANDIDDAERKARAAAVKAVKDLPETAPLMNAGDFTRVDPKDYELPDVLVGGTPCQGFSMAGLRGGLDDDRSNLALQFVRLAYAVDALREARGLRGLTVLWENVPGVLSMPDNAFGCLLGGFVGANEPLAIRGSWPDTGMARGPRARAAWRVLDAQYFGLAQRRERVFAVISFRDGPDPSAILFERQGLQGNSPPRREKGKDIAGALAPGSGGGCGPDDNDGAGGRLVAAPLRAGSDRKGWSDDLDQGAFIPEIVPQAMSSKWSKGSSGPAGDEVANLVAFSANDYGNGASFDLSPTLRAMPDAGTKPNAGQVMAIAFDTTTITRPTNRSNPQDGDPVHTLAKGQHPPALAYSIQERAVRENPDAGPDGKGWSDDGVAYTLEARENVQAVAAPGSFAFKPSHYTRGKDGAPSDTAPPLQVEADKGDQDPVIFDGPRWQVRRLTPTECERLQGEPDGWTHIVWRGKPLEECPDGPRYKALGNSFPSNVIKWLGQRIVLALKVVENGEDPKLG